MKKKCFFVIAVIMAAFLAGCATAKDYASLPEQSSYMASFVGSWIPYNESPPSWVWVLNSDGTGESWFIENFVIVKKSKVNYRASGSYFGMSSDGSTGWIRPYFFDSTLFNGSLNMPRHQHGNLLMSAQILIKMPETVRNMIREKAGDSSVSPELNSQPVTEFVINDTVLVKYQGTEKVVTIPSGVTAIGDRAFIGYEGLTAITIPAGVTSIGHFAFAGCSGLTAVTIPAGVTAIGDRAFIGCSGLTAVTIPAGVTAIGEGTFDDCSGLAAITIPASVTKVGHGAFRRCNALPTEIKADIEKRFGKEVFLGWQ